MLSSSHTVNAPPLSPFTLCSNRQRSARDTYLKMLSLYSQYYHLQMITTANQHPTSSTHIAQKWQESPQTLPNLAETCSNTHTRTHTLAHRVFFPVGDTDLPVSPLRAHLAESIEAVHGWKTLNSPLAHENPVPQSSRNPDLLVSHECGTNHSQTGMTAHGNPAPEKNGRKPPFTSPAPVCAVCRFTISQRAS